ncbi:kelch domain-containing protein 3-like [Amblyomma americanum]
MWTLRKSSIPKRINGKSVTINGKIYSIDNYQAVRHAVQRYLFDVYVFDPASHRWDVLQTESAPDSGPVYFLGHSVVAYGHCAYVWGKSNIRPWVNGVYRFDTRTLTWSRPEECGQMPRPHTGHSACVLGQRMYVFAGFSMDSPHHVFFLDLQTMKWHRVATSGEAPAQRCFHTATAIGTRMYVWGGQVNGAEDNDCYDNRLYYLETTTSVWVRPQVRGVRPVGRKHHAALVYDGELYICGGYSGRLGTCFADMHKYDLEKSCWTEVKPSGLGPSARYSHGCCALGQRVFVFGGHGPPPNPEDGEHIDDTSEEGKCCVGFSWDVGRAFRRVERQTPGSACVTILRRHAESTVHRNSR